MTVGRELERLTGLPLFHNHMAIELALPFFPFGHESFNRLVGSFRRRIFEEVAASEHPGLIFTYVWALDNPGDKEYVDRMSSTFTARDHAVCFVELTASRSERLRRNASPSRLSAKASKRDIEASEARLLQHDEQYQLNTEGEFYYEDRYLKVDNTDLAPEVVAEMIVQRFSLPRSS
jgi:hypothetical protein